MSAERRPQIRRIIHSEIKPGCIQETSVPDETAMELFPKGRKRLEHYAGWQREALREIVKDLRNGGFDNQQLFESLPEVAPRTIMNIASGLIQEGEIKPLPRGREKGAGKNQLTLQEALTLHTKEHPGERVFLTRMIKDLGLVNEKGRPLSESRAAQLYAEISKRQEVPPLKAVVDEKQAEIVRERRLAKSTAREASETEVKQLHDQGLGSGAISEITKKPPGTIVSIVHRLLKTGKTRRLRERPVSIRKPRTPQEIQELDNSVGDLRRNQKLGDKEIAARLGVSYHDVNNSIRRLRQNDPSILLVVRTKRKY